MPKIYNTDKMRDLFSKLDIPDTLQLSQGVLITNVSKCIDNHINCLEGRCVAENKTDYERLLSIYEKLKTK